MIARATLVKILSSIYDDINEYFEAVLFGKILTRDSSVIIFACTEQNFAT